MLDVIKFKYDLTVQKQTQSILSACIFYQINQMINYNAQFKDLTNKPRCLSHLGRKGICVSHQEFSKYFCVDRKRIEYAMKQLKDLGFIQFQKSVWIYPYPCEEEILFVADFYGVRKHVEILQVDK